VYSELKTSDFEKVQEFLRNGQKELGDKEISVSKAGDLFVAKLYATDEPSLT
jgi:hypothetical protein